MLGSTSPPDPAAASGCVIRVDVGNRPKVDARHIRGRRQHEAIETAAPNESHPGRLRYRHGPSFSVAILDRRATPIRRSAMP